MADKSFKVSISTPRGLIYEGRVLSLIAPGETGYFGILVDHAPLIANLVPGKITVKEPPDTQKTFDCAYKGILEVLENNVTILIDSA